MIDHNVISIAPMIGWTDRHYRFLFRHIARCPVLYTEMIMDSAILHNLDCLDNFIGFDRQIEPPLALQLGGNNPETLGKAVEACEGYGGFSEINLNCGCPSNKAKRCGFGAELMLEPDLVRQITSEMIRKSSSTEITAKCRIGTNVRNTWGDLLEFVHACRDGGVRKLIVHARICVLCGLSPAQNRNVPPLRYDIVSRLVESFPDMKFILNGGVRTYEETDQLLGYHYQEGEMTCNEMYTNTSIPQADTVDKALYDPLEVLSVPWTQQPSTAAVARTAPESGVHTSDLSHTDHSLVSKPLPHSTAAVHGVMVGREAYNNPWYWADADQHYYHQSNPTYTRQQTLDSYLTYAATVLNSDMPRSTIPYLCKPLHNFFTGSTGNKLYKRKLDNLLKVQVAHTAKFQSGHIVRTEGEDLGVIFDSIIREAVEETIPQEFLDTRLL